MWKTLRQIARVGRITEPPSAIQTDMADATVDRLQTEVLRLLGLSLIHI